VDGVQATELFESMVAPLAPYTLRGFLWYQGEANCMHGDTAIYAVKQRALVAAWRKVWQDAEAPFYSAQLAPFNYSHWDSFPQILTPEALPLFREAQARALDVPHTGMITITDLAGDAKDIHPTNKRDVGLRFAKLAMHETYGRTDVIARGPEFAGMRVVGASIEISFRHDAGGLQSRNGAPLTHFAIAGVDQNFQPAEAVIAGATVVVTHPQVLQPVAVRFGWHEAAAPNLVNGAGLPARPFRTDDWPVAHLRESGDGADGIAN
jgi:sialate O-acetylesterase